MYIQMNRKLRGGIILFIKDVINKDESLKPELNFYLDFYKNVYSNIHFYKLVNGLMSIRKMVLMHDSKFILNDPIFSIIELPNKVNILNKIWNHIDQNIIWKYYIYFLKISNIFCRREIFPQLADRQGYVINYGKLIELIKN